MKKERTLTNVAEYLSKTDDVDAPQSEGELGGDGGGDTDGEVPQRDAEQVDVGGGPSAPPPVPRQGQHQDRDEVHHSAHTQHTPQHLHI